MKIHVLFIKRKFSLANTAEAYCCHDEETSAENPDWPDTQVADMLKDCGTDMHGGAYRWITISVAGADIEDAFNAQIVGQVVAA